MNAANLISLMRLVLVPLVIWLVLDDRWLPALAAFVFAAVSDFVDGFLARRFGMQTKFGAMLDPVADKAMLISLFVLLGLRGYLPAWLVILLVSRDVVIVGGVLLSKALAFDQKIAPVLIGKANTAAQFLLVALVLASLSFQWSVDIIVTLLCYLTAATALLSAAIYAIGWHRSQAGGKA